MTLAPEGFDPSFYAALAEAEERHFWFRARSELIAHLVADRLGRSPGDASGRVLEVGCGTGAVLATLEALPGVTLAVGMDLFPEGLAFARQRTAAGLLRADAAQAPFAARFSVVGAFDVLEHLEDDVGFLRHAATLLEPGGAILVTVPAYAALWSTFDDVSHHVRRYAPAELTSVLRKAGLEVELLTPWMASIAPIVWLRRRLIGRRGPVGSLKPAALAELRIVPVLNALLLAVLRLEGAGVRRGLRLPFGTSLVAVARRDAEAPR